MPNSIPNILNEFNVSPYKYNAAITGIINDSLFATEVTVTPAYRTDKAMR